MISMKYFNSILISFIYILVSSGASVNLHYCGGVLEGIQINTESQSCCCGIVDVSSSCCDYEELILDMDVDENVASNLSIKIFSKIIFSSSSAEVFRTEQIEEEPLLVYNIPPPKSEPIWLLNCTFTFYG